MDKRNYYSVRTGLIKSDNVVNLDILKRQFWDIYQSLEKDSYFQKYFGIDCTDGFQPGILGESIGDKMFISIKKDNLYPIWKKWEGYTEDDLFDVIEYLYDHCSKGIDGTYHSWNNCGIHYHEFNDTQGKQDFRSIINPILHDYKDGFELSETGEVFILAEHGLSNIFEAEFPTNDTDNITKKIDAAISKFRRYSSSIDDRKEAIRELADVLEFLRPSIKSHMDKKDEDDIFNIANNFGIRHHNTKQKTDYDKPIWYSWMFYYYLATIHAIVRINNKN